MKIIGVIRSIGERTEEFSKSLLGKQVDEIFLVKDIKPIKNMTINCIEIGLNTNADYMITCDADVLPYENSVEFLVDYMKKENNIVITGYTISKFLGKRQGGLRIWNCKKIDVCISTLTNYSETQQRPEAFINRTHNGLLIDVITSLHEYEQYYIDIYRCFLNKSQKQKKIENLVKTFAYKNDFDYIVAYHGYFDEEKNFKKSFPNLIEKEKIDTNNKIELPKTVMNKYNK